MDVRKISIGPDYKSGAMHYIIGQDVLGGNYSIHNIEVAGEDGSIKIWIIKKNEIYLWKSFNSTIPVSVEYNINF